MEVYANEEEQVEALKVWWKENGRSVIFGAILGAVLIGAWNFWQQHRDQKTQQASALYGQLLVFINQGQDESAQKLSEQLVKDYANTSYAAYAGLMQAKLKVKAGDFAGAKQLLEAQTKQKDPELQNVARLRLVRLLLATGEYEKGLQLINETDPAIIGSFSPNYDELTGDLYVALDRLGEARTSYERALRAGLNSPLLQFKLDDITAPEIVAPPAS